MNVRISSKNKKKTLSEENKRKSLKIVERVTGNRNDNLGRQIIMSFLFFSSSQFF